MARLQRTRARQFAAVPASVTLVCPIDSSHRFTVTPSTPQVVDNWRRHFEGRVVGTNCVGAVDDSGAIVGPHQARVITKSLLPAVNGGTFIEVDVRRFFGVTRPVYLSHVAGNFECLRTQTGYAFFQLKMEGAGGGLDRARNPDLFAWYNAVPLVSGTVMECRIGKQGGQPAPCNLQGQPDFPPFAIEVNRQLDRLTLSSFETTQDTDKVARWAMQLRGF